MKSECTCVKTSPVNGRAFYGGNLFTRSVLVMMLVLAAVMPKVSGQTNFTTGNLAVLVDSVSKGGSATLDLNTSGYIFELSPTTAGQTSPVKSVSLPTSFRFYAAKATGNYMSNSNDGSLLVFNAWQPTNYSASLIVTTTGGEQNHAAGIMNNSYTFSSPTGYTESSTNNSRSATTVDNVNYIMDDQAGIYFNGTTSFANNTNFLSVKAFGGTVYGGSAKVNIVSSINQTTGAPTALPGLGTDGVFTDFYMLSSGATPGLYDIMYVIGGAGTGLLGTSNSLQDTIFKYVLSSGTWIAAGNFPMYSGTITHGVNPKINGISLAAELIPSSTKGCYIYVTSGDGLTSNNSVYRFTDSTAYSASMVINSFNNLFTLPSGTVPKKGIIRGIAFAPTCVTLSSAVASSNSPICAGSNLNLTSSATGQFSFSWAGPNSFSSTSENPSITNATTAATGVYTVTITNSCGSTTTATTSVTVGSVPNVYSMTGGGSYCSGGSGVTIGLSGSDNSVNYQLYNGATAVGSAVSGSGSAITFGPITTAATYTVQATNTTSPSCPVSMTGSETVTVTSNVTPSVSIAATPGNQICTGGTASFTATPTNGGSSPSYQWYVNSNPVGTNSATLAASTYNNGDQVTCTLTSSSTCVTSSTASSNTITMSVGSVVPAVSIASSSGTNSCAGASVSFTATPTNGGSTPSYQWYYNGSTAGSNSATYINNSLNTNDSIRCVMTSSNGCASPTTGNSNEIVMTVTANVTPSVSIGVSPGNSICGGIAANFTATPTNGGSSPSYQWTKNGSNISGANSSTYSNTGTGIGNGNAIACVMTSSLACVTSATGTSSSITMTVLSTPAPSITVTGGSTYCSGSPSTLDAGAGYASYSWSNGASTETIQPTSSGTYTVTVSNGSCTGTSTSAVTVNPSPKVFGQGTNVTCNGSANGSAVAEVVSGTSPFTYSWSNGSTGASATTLNTLAPGNYNVTVTDHNGCTATSKKLIHYWDFNSTAPCGGGGLVNVSPVAPSFSQLGHAAVVFNQVTSPSRDSILDNVAGTTVNERAGYGVINTCGGAVNDAVRTRNPNNEEKLLFYLPTTNYKNLLLSFACEASSAGKDTNIYSYSLDSGATFITTNLSQLKFSPGLTYALQTIDLSSVTTANNNPRFVFAISNNVVAASGNVRYDNVTLEGDSISSGGPAIASVSVTQPAVLGASISASTNVSCFGGSNGTATATGTGGTAPYTYSWSIAASTAAVSNLAPGTYTVTINDSYACTPKTASVTITQPASALTSSITGFTDLLCNGSPTGSATAAGAGGTSPYAYAWSNSANTATASALAAATYTVTVSDANTCHSTTAAVITQPSTALTSSIGSIVNATCNGGSNGSATISGSGGTTPYASYSWSTTAATAAVSGLSAATYTASVTDANGCVSSSTVSITAPSAVGGSIISSANISCNGAGNGTATAQGTGGITPYAYSWSDSSTNAIDAGMAPNTYTVSITDAYSCATVTATVSISQPSVLSVTAANTSTSTCNAQATAIGAGGTVGSGYSYSWSNGAASAVNGGISSGTYTVTVTDANGCNATTSINIVLSSAVGATISQTNVTCNGLNNGSMTVTASGGAGGYLYSWSTGSASTTISSLSPATYTVVVTDAASCSTSATAAITQPVALTVAISSSVNVSCAGGSNGSATASGNGGTTPYAYTWSTGSAVALTSNLVANTFTVSVSDANQCAATTSVTINQPSALGASISSSTQPSCFGGTNGAATAAGANGTPGYSYRWSTSATTATVSTLSSGSTYTITVTDANGCTKTTTASVGQPTVVTSSITSTTNPPCFGLSTGAATVSGSGGTGAFTYNWSSGATSATAASLAAGTYTVTVKDAHSCSTTTTAAITQPAAVTASISASTNVSCHGGSNGTATVAGAGGTSPYAYNWSNGGTTASVSGLASGTYTVSVKDANNCAVGTTTVAITQPAVISASIPTVVNIACYNQSSGSLTASGTGGTGAFSYNWSNGAATATAAGLTIGTYTVTVTDASNCASATKTATLTQPSTAVSVSVPSDAQPTCYGGNNGTATALGTGGTGTISYLWSDGSTTATATGLSAGVSTTTYTVTVSDANLCTSTTMVTLAQPGAVTGTVTTTGVFCNGGSSGTATASGSGGTGAFGYDWSSGSTTALASGLSFGAYTVTITDANGCTGTTTASVSQPGALSSSVSAASNVSCFGGNNGSATVTGVSGTSPYHYTWNTGGANATKGLLTQGSYTATVTDANGCTTIQSVSITQPATSVTASTGSIVNDTDFGQSNGSATATAGGGTSPYNYSWSSGATTATARGLADQTYTVTVTDANGCIKTATATITEPNELTAVLDSATNAPCGHNGTVTVTASGGRTPYTYSWGSSVSLTGATGLTTSAASGLAAGSYTLTVTDNLGATATATATVTSAGTIIVPVEPGTISGAATLFCGVVQSYSITPVKTKAGLNMPGYTWTVPAGDSIESGQGTNSINVKINNAGTSGSITVASAGTCANSIAKSLTVKAGVIAAPSSVIGVDAAYNGTSGLIYSVKKVTNATAYTWTVPTGMTLVSGQNTDSITVNTGAAFTGGNITVTAGNGCSTGGEKTQAVKQSIISKPGSITGSKSVYCGTSAVTYSIKSLAGASSYVWTVPSGAVIASGQGTDAISVNFLSAFAGGSVSVYAANIGYSTAASSFAVAKTELATASKVSGPASVYCNVSSTQYYIAAISNATTYLWTVPAGMTIVSGQGRDTITVNIGGNFSGGSVTVEAGNGCSYGAGKSLAVAVNKLSAPASVVGESSVLCGSQSVDYTIPTVTGASKYTWAVPSGDNIVSGQGTNSIAVDFGSSVSGDITVQADGCDSTVFSKATSLALKAAALAAPVTINGATSGLGVSSGVVPYYVANVAGVTNSWSESSGITLVRTSTNTDTIYVSFLSAFKTGTLSVVSSNGCTSSKATSLALSNKSGEDKLNNGADQNSLNTLSGGKLLNISELYPNPTAAGSTFNLQINASKNALVLVQLYDVMGNLISSKQVPVSTGDNLISNALYVPAGLYMMKITDSNNTETYTKRLVIE